MNIDIEQRINDLILQEQTLQEQLRSVQLQKTRLQTVLQVWINVRKTKHFTVTLPRLQRTSKPLFLNLQRPRKPLPKLLNQLVKQARLLTLLLPWTRLLPKIPRLRPTL